LSVTSLTKEKVTTRTTFLLKSQSNLLFLLSRHPYELRCSSYPTRTGIDRQYRPARSTLEQLILKIVYFRGEVYGQDLSEAIGLQFSVIEDLVDGLKLQHLLQVILVRKPDKPCAEYL